ncbi:TKL protein kinase [Salpingoeca rosetta]|uniref:TKL protein kinase n=1 Tax=Salpingoeca rosetta (strain ATCC 50818 / BSB-021) TaxID=946362 RepID=F2UQH6_SALR5|nr:TKL protein kinase [Salpingoeca rosetta]EGD79881.1 TKL protein kinase [Salpingoeca rosetta]|eukprot:XP_004988502.1 TKL protein kinase [Salpingoeca rosetta]
MKVSLVALVVLLVVVATGVLPPCGCVATSDSEWRDGNHSSNNNNGNNNNYTSNNNYNNNNAQALAPDPLIGGFPVRSSSSSRIKRSDIIHNDNSNDIIHNDNSNDIINSNDDEEGDEGAPVSGPVLKNRFSPVEVPSLQYTPVLYHTTEVVTFQHQEDLQGTTVANLTRLIQLGGTKWDSVPGNIGVNQIQIHSVETWRRCRDLTPDVSPSGFTLHTSVQFADHEGIFIYGGLTPTGEGPNKFENMQELFLVNIYANFAKRIFECHWEPVQTQNPPQPRHGHAMVKLNEFQFIIHGGCGDHKIQDDPTARVRFFFICIDPLRDMHLFDIRTRMWTRLEVQGAPQLVYHHMSLLTADRQLILFGGYTEEQVVNTDMLAATVPRGDVTEGTALVFEHVQVSPVPQAYTRGAIDAVADDTIHYFLTPSPGSHFDKGRKLISLQGQFVPGTDHQQFVWRLANVFPSADHPWSAGETLRSFALGGGFAFAEVHNGRGVLSGVFLNDATGDLAPVWEVFDFNNRVMSFSVLQAFTQPSHRSYAEVVQLDDSHFLLAGGASPGPDDTAWLLIPDKLDIRKLGDMPTFVTRPNPRNAVFARFGFCLVNVPESDDVLIAGGTTSNQYPALDDYFFHVSSANVTSPLDDNPTYASLHMYGHRCFRRGSTVIAVGGIPTGGANVPVLAMPLLHFWTPQQGWVGCNVPSATHQPTLAAMEMLRTHSDGREEVVIFGGYNGRDSAPQGTHDMFAVGCRVPWEACTCDDVTFRQIVPDPEKLIRNITVRTLQTLDEDAWPAPRSSACSAQVGASRLVMHGGHIDGRPWQSTWMLEMNEGEPTWSEIGDDNRVPTLRPDATYGAACFAHKGAFVAVGGAGNGRLTDSIHVMRPSCNAGWGVASSFLNETCARCDEYSFRADLTQETCTPCPVGTRRQNATTTLGLSSTSCQMCVPGYCVHATHQQIEFVENKARCRCHCRSFFYGDRCNNVSTQRVLLVTLLPLLLLVALLTSGRVYRYFTRLRTTSALQQRLLSEKDDELLELHASWEVSPDDLVYHHRLGEGGFGEVWLATWLVRDERVAVKKLHTNLLDEETMHAFEGEIRFMKTLRHRNVVFFLGAYVGGSESLIVMEYVQRGSLHDHIHNTSSSSGTSGSGSAITQRRRVAFMRDTACGMEYLHGLNPPRIHRDLKSMNLLVTDNWVVKVADFTTAKKLLCKTNSAQDTRRNRRRGANPSTSTSTGGDDDNGSSNGGGGGVGWRLKRRFTSSVADVADAGGDGDGGAGDGDDGSGADSSASTTPNNTGSVFSSNNSTTTNSNSSNNNTNQAPGAQMPDANARVYVNTTSTYGTLHWSAPEVLAGQPYSLAVDVYSFGLVMWETLARDVPYAEYRFFGQLRDAVVDRRERPACPPSLLERGRGDDGVDEERARAVDDAYVSLMQRCWVHEPTQRPTFTQVSQELQAMVQQLGGERHTNSHTHHSGNRNGGGGCGGGVSSKRQSGPFGPMFHGSSRRAKRKDGGDGGNGGGHGDGGGYGGGRGDGGRGRGEVLVDLRDDQTVTARSTEL